ncbi:MAG: hypothetical protein JSW20_00805 [Nitrospiraceae bacterium]|nr:MAG: hypothetical protein JSW20_00805 [Nitrospiraceae bacterium]
MTRNLVLFKLLFFSILCFLQSESSAIMTGMSTEHLTMESDHVVQGEIKDVKARWSSDGKSIISRALLIKQKMIKGMTIKRNLIVEYEGGEIGDVGLRVSDVAPLKAGEWVILFLRVGRSLKEGEVFNIVGKGQGKYVIGDDGIARKK